MQDTRTNYTHYSATWVEWILTIAGVASFLFFFTIGSKFVTIVPISGLGEETEKKETEPVAAKEILPA